MVAWRKHIAASITLLTLLSCEQHHKAPRVRGEIVYDQYQPAFTAAQLDIKLERGYKQNNLDSIQQYFNTWNEGIAANAQAFIYQSDAIEAIFDVFKEFYKPFDLLKLGQWEWGNKLNSACEYAVVQNKLFYVVVPENVITDFDWRGIARRSVLNFRPPLTLDRHKVLYLTSEYEKSLNDFLGTQSTKVGAGNIMDPSLPEGESEKRYKMIRSFIPILHGHWGEYWHLETHPYVEGIAFNQRLTQAKIDFRVGYQGGEATLAKQAGHWKIVESKATWIE